MAKTEDRKKLEQRREAVKRFMAQGMKQAEIVEALVKEGRIPEDKGGIRTVERDMRAIRREEARTPKKEYLRRLEEIREMAASGEKKDLKVMFQTTKEIAKVQGVETGDVKLTPDTLAALPRWRAVMKRCGIPKQNSLKPAEKPAEGGSEKAEPGKP